MVKSLIPAFVVFILLVVSIATTFVIFHSSIHRLQLNYQSDIAKVNDNLLSVQSQQASYVQQVTTLTSLVFQSLNATDEYINNVTNTVSEAQDVIHQDMATVQDIQQNQNSLMAVQFAGMFTILVILVSGYHLSQHIRHMHEPVVQRKIMAVLWMTPVYSMSSWLSLVFESAEPYLAVVREFYESYCVYMFLSFLIAVLGRGDRRAVITLLELRADQLSKPDKCRCGPKAFKRLWQGCCNRCGKRRRVPNDHNNLSAAAMNTNGDAMGPPGMEMTDANAAQVGGSIDEYGNYVSADRIKAEAVLDQCQMYAMQFVLLRPLTAIGWLISNQLVEPTHFLDPTTPQLYITIITNGSIFFAFRGLVRFYHATRSNLAWCNPWPKFLCIKGVVFMTFWQRMMLSLIVNIGYAEKFDSQDQANDFIMQAQNFLICLEMLFSAVAHCFVFSPEEWSEGYREKEEQRRRISAVDPARFGDSVALGDFFNDVKVVMASKKRRRKRKKILKEGLPSLNSMEEEDEGNSTQGNNLGSAQSTSTGGDPEDGDYFPRVTSMESGESEELDQSTESSFDNAEYVMELKTPSPLAGRHRQRLDTGGSVDSDGGEVIGSLERIEKFILELTPKSDGKREIV